MFDVVDVQLINMDDILEDYPYRRSVESMRRADLFDPDVPSECNRVTNTPCSWSNTPAIEDDCVVCKRKFPNWQ